MPTYEDPVAVETHIPDDHTFSEFWILYILPPKRVTVPYWPRGNEVGSLILPSPACGSGTGFIHPIRNLDTAAGLGFAISKSFNAVGGKG